MYSAIGHYFQSVSESLVSMAPAGFHLTAEESSNHMVGKMITIPIVFVLHLGSALAPWLLEKATYSKMFISFATCLSAGAMLGIGLLHVFPESREVWEEYLGTEEDEHDHAHSLGLGHRSHGRYRTLAEEEGHSHAFPWTELLAGLVVLLLISIELIAMRYLQRRGNIEHCHGHAHGDDDAHVHGASAPPAVVHAEEEPARGEYATFDTPSDAQPEHCLDVHAHMRGHSHSHAPCDGDAHSHAGDAPSPTEMESGLAPFDGIGIKEPVVVPDTQERTVVPDDTAEEAVMVDKETADKIKRNKLYLDAFISSLAICIHSLFTGLALGADTSSDSAFWTFFGATVGHKMIDGFATGVPVYRAKMPFLYSLFLIALGALAAPIGILIGYFSTNSSEANLGQAIVMSMSGGSFIFVACFEMIPAGLGKGTTWLLSKLFTMFVGFAIVAVVAEWA